MSPDSILLYEDEKGPIVAKTYMVVRLGLLYNPRYPIQKIRGILNVFDGAYDHTNNQMCTHGYRNKTGKQFLDFIKRVVDQKYDSSVKQIFLILDNASIHKSKSKTNDGQQLSK